MGSRTDLQTLLETLLGSNKVYFQPPSTITMIYPCIVYQRSDIDTKYANNNPYALKKQYTVTVIEKNPDSIIPDKVAQLESCMFDRHYVVDNLYHDSFILFY